MFKNTTSKLEQRIHAYLSWKVKMSEDSSLHHYIDGLSKYAPSISVIYAEDEPNIREQLSRFLSRFFTDIRVAADGKEALEYYNDRRCDIVITDIMMPNVSGLELCTDIREQHPDQKIIIISAHSDSNRLIDLINIGVDKFMLKPIDNKLFIRRLFAIARELYEHKQIAILHEKLEENFASLGAIIEMMNDALVILEDNQVIQANKRFLDIAKVATLDEFLLKSNRIDSIFVSAKGYTSHCTNEELINLCKSGDTIRAVVNSDSGAAIVLISHSYINDKKSILTLADVTSMEKEILISKKKLQTNPITNISNKSAFIEKFTESLQSAECSLALVSFAKYNQQLKLYGKESVINAEKLLVDAIKSLLDSHALDGKVFFANYDKNAFILICDRKNIQFITTRIFEKEIAVSSENQKNQMPQIAKFSTIVKSLEFKKDANVTEGIRQIEAEFASMLQTA